MMAQITVARSPILARLKAETAPLHDALERRLDIVARLDSPGSYRALLGPFLGFYEPVEARLRLVGELDGLPLGLAERWKSSRLAADLRVLGYSIDQIAALPRCPAPPRLMTPAEAFGCLYVLEGATLGGQLIARLLTRRFGLGPDSGAAFFASYGDRVGPMWRELGAALTRFVGETGTEDAVVRSACDTFAAFDRWLAESP